ARLAARGKAGELPLVAPHAKARRHRGLAVDRRQAVLRRALYREPFVAAEQTVEPTILERTDAVAHVVADAVRGVDERVVPFGIKQSGERMRLVMIDETKVHVRPKAVLGDEAVGAEQLLRFLPGAGRQHGKVAAEPLAPGAAARGVIKVAQQRKAQIVHRKK